MRRFTYIWLIRQLLLAGALWMALGQPAIAQEGDEASIRQLTLGVLAAEGATRTLETWSDTQALLNDAAARQGLPFSFQVKPHTDASLLAGVTSGQIDLMLGDPATFVVAQVEEGARALLSVAHIWEGTTYDQTGALVFVRSDSGVQRFEDISGQRIIGVAPQELTGWKLAKQEFRKHRLNVDKMSSDVMFSGGNQREVVYAVRNGLADVGVVRAGVLEGLAKEGIISLDEFRPLMPMNYRDYPFWVSTPLYPSWVLAALPSVEDSAVALIIDTLLEANMASDVGAAADRVVWQAPQNYRSVHELMISLRAPPYHNYLRQAAARIYFEYKWPVIGLSTAIFLSVLFLLHEMRRHARVSEARKNVLQSETHSKRFYREAIEKHTLFCMLSKDGNITHANKHFADALDRTAGSLVQSALAAALKDNDQETLAGPIMEAMAAGKPWQGALQLLKEDGDTVWFQCSFVPIMGASKALREIAIVASDVTKTHQGASEYRFNNTLELLQDQIVVLRPSDLSLSYVNSAAERALIKGRMGGDWRGKKVQDFITDEDLRLLQMRCQSLQEGPQRRIVWETQGKGEVTYEISLEYAQPEHDAPCFIAIYRDVSERKAIEKAKNEFIATVSHELRTPLTSIKGALGLATSGAIGEMPEKMNGVIDMAATSCDRLVVLINDILDLEKIEAGKMDYKMQYFDLNDLIADVMQSNAFYGEEFGVTFERLPQPAEADYTTYGDPARLIQVMDNLMSNAAKFSEKGSKVNVGLSALEDRLRITVRDFGAGIPRKAQATIFDKFTQADSSDTRSKGGTGLGLSIVKMIVEHHEGRVCFVSEEGQGTEFFVDLPMVRENAVVPVDALRDPQDVPRQFSASSPAHVVPLPQGDSPIHRLMEKVRNAGHEIKVEIDRVTTGQIVKGRGLTGNSTAMNWLDADQRGFLVKSTEAGQVANRSVAIIELTQAAGRDGAVAHLATEAAELILDWADDCLGNRSGPNEAKITVLSPIPEVRQALAGQASLTVREADQANPMSDWKDCDLILRLSHSNGALCAALYPGTAADLPDDLPFLLLASRIDEVQNAKGVVSKFSSGGGARRRRRA